MLLELSTDLKNIIFLYLENKDLLKLSYVCKHLRYFILKSLKCSDCNKFENVALCYINMCDKLLCPNCFTYHYSWHYLNTLDFNPCSHFPIPVAITKTKNNIFSFIVEYKDSDDDDNEN
jgi:hypothetical protein